MLVIEEQKAICVPVTPAWEAWFWPKQSADTNSLCISMTILVLNHWWKISVWIVHSENEPGWALLPSGGMSWDLIIAIVIWHRKSLMPSIGVSLVSFIIYVQNTYYSYILECKQLQKYASNLPCINHSCRLILNQESNYLMFLNFRYTEQLTCFRLLWYHSLTEGHFNTLHLEWQIQSEACSATLPVTILINTQS